MNQSPRDPSLGKLLQALDLLAEVYEAGSFSRAAERLGIDQSAVSHRVRALEAALGFTLFERTTRRVTPTRAGTLLCQAAGRASADLAQALAAARELRSGGAIRLSVPSSLAMKWLVPRLADARRDGLDLSLEVREDLAALDQGQIDAAIRFGPGPYPGHHAQRLARCRLQPVASPAYLRHAGVSAEGASLIGLGRLADRRGEQDGTRFSWADYLVASGGGPIDGPAPMYFDRADLMLQAAIGGLGVALGRSLLIEDDIRLGLLVPVGPSAPSASDYWLVTRYESADTESMNRLMRWLERGIAHTLAAG
ncbi:LysR substrate-binding domain-containing protein [Denitromonas iodatirespirans]|uniref:LysR family transcriptional regulator n=1 Tax=Denitromonas iodatirespirans TaxID=2795389 RepID=A0A944DCA2_DENI1|nr:LysR substrate-binding domain-containing protein [Denitromonas iodatirespirans]MBT0963854.1 LysR family transcriptional regulator [Denitromonas iodatirespirans]